jgi:effector-binding domain-containing protein
MKIDTPKIVEFAGHASAAVIHLKDIPRESVKTETAVCEVLHALTEQGVKPSGPLFAHHLTQSSKVFDMEVGFPVEKAIVECGRVKNSSLPSGTMAYSYHVGPFDELYAAWKEFAEWLTVNSSSMNLKKGDTLFEIYTVGPETTNDASKWRTEMYQTLK